MVEAKAVALMAPATEIDEDVRNGSCTAGRHKRGAPQRTRPDVKSFGSQWVHWVGRAVASTKEMIASLSMLF